MSALSFLSARPMCLLCMGQAIRDDLAQTSRLSYTQLRGKKKAARKPTTINVKLLKDIKGYGRKGSIVPVAPGLFRNTWFPRGRAEYISTLQVAKPKEIIAERDFTFGLEQDDTRQAAEPAKEPMGLVERARSVAARTNIVSPERASQILDSKLPSQIIFYRVPINEPEPELSPSEIAAQQRRDASPAAAILAAASPSVNPRTPDVQKIFGSVTTADMAEVIKAMLETDDEGARVVIGAEDISILGEDGADSGIEGDRLKALGKFQVEVRVRGAESVLRTVSVRAQQAPPAAT
ncbi:MAG: hypothetical protein Q9164_003707 [Protoblastenia rupestris]